MNLKLDDGNSVTKGNTILLFGQNLNQSRAMLCNKAQAWVHACI